MLQQTQVKTVLSYWRWWMEALPDVQSVARATPGKLLKLWEGLGYYTRVRNLQRAARIILEKHGGKFPERFEDVLALPGIGRYTAGAICSIAFNQSRPILDGNVIRVVSRLFGVRGNPRVRRTNARLWQLSEELVGAAASLPPPRSRSRFTFHVSLFNQSLMELGALICTPQSPRCHLCPVARQCQALRQGLAGRLPELPTRLRPARRRFVAFVVRDRGRFLVRQRPAGVINAHLWEFPNVELRNGSSGLEAARSLFGAAKLRLEPLCTIKHSITRYRLTLNVLRLAAERRPRVRFGHARWLRPARLRRLPFASAHKQILERLARHVRRVAPSPPLGERGPFGGTIEMRPTQQVIKY